MPLSDEERIIQECISGNVEKSFGILVQRYQTTLLQTAYHFLGNWEDAKDATQEAFIRAYRSLKKFHPNRCFSAWLYRILINVCKDRCKSAYHRYRTPLDDSTKDRDVSSNPVDMLAEKELLRKALNRLSMKRRQTLILVDMEGFSSPEVAKILGCSESTVRVTLMKARQQLRKIYLKLSEL